jgi:hypothetical protein
MVAVAQSVEHRIVIPVVVGSIPISHPLFFKSIAYLLTLFSGGLPRDTFESVASNLSISA